MRSTRLCDFGPALIAMTHSIFAIEHASHWGLYQVFFRDSRADLTPGGLALTLRGRGVFVSSRLDPQTGKVDKLLEETGLQRSQPLTRTNGFGRQVLATIDGGTRALVRRPGARTVAAVNLSTGSHQVLLQDATAMRLLAFDEPRLLTLSAQDGARVFARRTLVTDDPSRVLLRIEDKLPHVQTIVQTLS